MEITLQYGTKDARLISLSRHDFTPDQVVDALNKQLEAARVLWPELASVEIVDNRVLKK